MEIEHKRNSHSKSTSNKGSHSVSSDNHVESMDNFLIDSDSVGDSFPEGMDEQSTRDLEELPTVNAATCVF